MEPGSCNWSLSCDDLLSHDCTLNLAGHRVQSGSHAEVVESFVLLPDGILSVDPGSFDVALCEGLQKQGVLIPVAAAAACSMQHAVLLIDAMHHVYTCRYLSDFSLL